MSKNIVFYVLLFFSLVFPCLTQSSQTVEPDFEDQYLSEVSREANEALESGSLSKAIHLYEEFLSAFPNSSEAMAYLGGVYGTKEDFQKEVELCQKAIQLNPTLAVAYINLGNAQLSLQKWSESEQSFLTAYKIAAVNNDISDLRTAAYSLSNYYLASQHSDNQKAIQWADTCIRHLPKRLVEGRGLLSGFGGQFKSEIRELIWVYQSATMNKAGAYANMKDFDTALSILREYLEKCPENGDVKEMFHAIETYKEKRK